MVIYLLDCHSILSLNWEPLWSFLTALATIALVGVGYFQLRKIAETNKDANKISQEKFLYQLRTEFFTKKARELLTLIEEDALKFDEKNEIFNVDIPIDRKDLLRDSINVERKYYTPQEIDDFLLGPLEDAALLLEKKLIDVRDASYNFGYYLNAVLSYSEISSYIKWARKCTPGRSIYRKVEWAFHSVAAFEKKRRPKVK